MDEGVWYRESVFSVNDVVRLLKVAPATVRCWIQRNWLFAEKKMKQGYQICFFDLHVFLLGYGNKLRGLPSANINDLIPEAYQPSPLSEKRQNELRREKREKWRRKRYREYKAWAHKTYEAMKRILLEQLASYTRRTA